MVALIAGAAQGIFVVLFILFVARRLHGGAGEIGLLRGVQAIGAICAGLVLGLSRRSLAAGWLTAIGALTFGALDLFLWNAPALTTGIALYVLLFVVVGAPGVVMETGLISSLQLSSHGRRTRTSVRRADPCHQRRTGRRDARRRLADGAARADDAAQRAGLPLSAGRGARRRGDSRTAPRRSSARRGRACQPGPMNLELIRRLEAAAVRSWPATVTRAAPGGWLLRATPGLDRGRSNNALTPCRALDDAEIAPAIELVCAFSNEHSIRPGIQVSPLGLHDPLQKALDRRGWSRQWPTVVMTGPPKAIDARPAHVSSEDHASSAWLRAWGRCEPGRDLDAHANTVFALLRGRACFARIGSDAVGIGVRHDQLVGMYCIAVDPAYRRDGLGTAIVSALLGRLGDGAELAYLQVEETNAAACGLYGKLGFTRQYRYCHRVR